MCGLQWVWKGNSADGHAVFKASSLISENNSVPNQTSRTWCVQSIPLIFLKWIWPFSDKDGTYESQGPNHPFNQSRFRIGCVDLVSSLVPDRHDIPDGNPVMTVWAQVSPLAVPSCYQYLMSFYHGLSASIQPTTTLFPIKRVENESNSFTSAPEIS
jgi:hypothetical protein